MTNWILCGLPGSGKTTYGIKLAQLLGLTFLDTDREVETLYANLKGEKLTSRQITQREGVQFFRDLERKVVSELQGRNQTIIAIGGGTLTVPENRPLLRQLGCIIYLQADPKDLLKRILAGGMPTYLDPNNPEGSFLWLVEERLPIYEECAHCIVDTRLKEESEVLSQLYQLITKKMESGGVSNQETWGKY